MLQVSWVRIFWFQNLQKCICTLKIKADTRTFLFFLKAAYIIIITIISNECICSNVTPCVPKAAEPVWCEVRGASHARPRQETEDAERCWGMLRDVSLLLFLPAALQHEPGWQHQILRWKVRAFLFLFTSWSFPHSSDWKLKRIFFLFPFKTYIIFFIFLLIYLFILKTRPAAHVLWRNYPWWTN